ncbi:ChbG/HpnK family deacetylase [Virgibacillus halodenitrificans]|uniref:ChbG/HpnK family deacetylase n=1 Tax=Virgibacillus halodenitrificans TaxID=1482 RepID=UPI00045CAA2B|nr:ChbG/HpnK family deacetylase [Virgibacillus halodenitrificans]CDQ31908.1 hopanoid biosynthesis associated protein HpnK [Virgibacillus halodenitrificans]
MDLKQRRLIMNADDLGLSPGVTAGILYAHQYGLVSSTTAMVTTRFSKDCLQEAKHYSHLGIGLHFVLDAGQPLSPSVPSLTDNKNNFLKGKDLIENAKGTDIKEELKRQLELLLSWGIDVTHIDSHHHMHLHIPGALEIVYEVAHHYKLPVRVFTNTTITATVPRTDYFHFNFYGENNLTEEYLINMITNLDEGTSEIMCHPGFLDTWLTKTSSYQQMRMKEVEILVSNRIRKCLDEQNVQLVHYGGI